MKPDFAYRFFLMSIYALLSLGSMAQLTQVFHDVAYTDDGSIPGYPDGATTYRIWAQMDLPTDALIACFAVDNNTLLLGTDQPEGIWNSEFGAITGSELNAALFGAFPEVEHDSFVTIGRANNEDPGFTVSTASNIPSATVFDDAFSTMLEPSFNADLELGDGAWFSVADNINVFGQGPDNLILLAQITTTGELEYQLNLQILIGGAGGATVKFVWDEDAVDPVDDELDGSLLGLEYPSSLCVISEADISYSCSWSPEEQKVIQTFELSANATSECSPDSITFSNAETEAFAGTFDLSPFANELITTGSADLSELLETLDQDVSYNFSIFYTNNAGSGNQTAVFNFEADCGIIAGCTSDLACNYNPQATVNNGSCRFQSNTSLQTSIGLHIYPTDEGVPYSGTFECDEIGGAWFCFKPANDSVSIYASGADFDIRLRLYDATESLLTLVNDQSDGSETLEDYEVTPGGVFYIQITGLDLPSDPADYDFDIQLTDDSGTVLIGDLDGNGILTPPDFLDFLALLGTSNPAADFDGNGWVSTSDLLKLIILLKQASVCP